MATTLRVPMARVLKALTPKANLARDLWPSLTRTNLAVKAGYTRTSGTVNRALFGISEESGSGPTYLGLLDRGLVKRFDLDVDGRRETHYQITARGLQAIKNYGKLPKHKDKASCVNERYFVDGVCNVKDA